MRSGKCAFRVDFVARTEVEAAARVVDGATAPERTFAFADLFEVRGLKRVQRGKSAMRSDPGFGRTEIKYEGIDGKIRTSVLVFDPPPTNLPKNLASYELELQPLEHYSACLTIECNQEARNPSRRFLRSMIAASHELKSTTRRAATVLRRMHC